jgi:flavin-binding protein dodecin
MPSNHSSQRHLVGLSPVSVDDAIDRALVQARDLYGEPDWFEVSTARGFIKQGQVTHYEVTVQLGYETASRNRNADPYLDTVISSRPNRRVHNTIDWRF